MKPFFLLIMNEIVWGFLRYNCPDNDGACMNVNCSVISMQRRSGIRCDVFPYFTTLSNKNNKLWEKSSTNYYICESHDCLRWYSKDISCHCNENDYCDGYTCYKDNVLFKECECDRYWMGNNSTSGCLNWNCTEYDGKYTYLTEKYCDKYVNNSELWCVLWNENKIDLNRTKWKIESCKCISDNSTSVCGEWICQEKSMNYRHLKQNYMVFCCFFGSCLGLSVFVFMNWNCIHSSILRMTQTLSLLGIMYLILYLVGLAGLVYVLLTWILLFLLMIPCIRYCYKHRQIRDLENTILSIKKSDDNLIKTINDTKSSIQKNGLLIDDLKSMTSIRENTSGLYDDVWLFDDKPIPP